MNVRRIVLFNVIAIVIVLTAVYGGYTYLYDSSHYVSTDNAFVEGKEIPIGAEFPGDLQAWSVANGSIVTAGQTLGQMSTATELQTLGVAGRSPAVQQAVQAAANIRSPLSGTVSQVAVQAGQMVAPGEALAEVVDGHHLYVLANISETDIRHVQVGDVVDITVDAYPDLSLKGAVQSIGLAANSFFSLIPASDAASGIYTKVRQTIPVTIALSGYAGSGLRPGLSATVRIHRQTQ